MRYNRYGDDFLIDKIQPDKLGDELLSAGELEAEEEWQVIDDGGHYPQDDYSTPELETDLEQSEIERRGNTNLRILEWMRDVKDESREGQSIQQIDVSAANYMKTEDPLFGWTATDRPLDIPKDNSDPDYIDGDVDKYFCPGSGGRTYPHRKFDDKEAQGSEGNKRIGTGGRRTRAYHRKEFQNEIRNTQ